MSINQDRIISWNYYAESFHSIMPPVMVELNSAVAKKLYGRIVDYGCGAAKLLPYLNSNSEVKSYTGVDMSKDMLELADVASGQYSNLSTQFIHGNILDVSISECDCAVSINSFYSWPDPKKIVRKIFEDLNEQGVFVIGTLSKSINMRQLLDEAEPMFTDNQYWPDFKRLNIDIIDHPNTYLVDLPQLCDLLTDVGFEIVRADDQFYSGGLCLVEAKK